MTSPEIKKSVPMNQGTEYNGLTTEYIIILHDEAIESFGGEKGFLSISNVDHLIYLFNNRKYDVIKKAALALDLITAKHAFVDGNKRTGHLVASILLEKEGFYINTDNEKMLSVLLKIAKYECTMEDIIGWLKKNVSRLHMS